MVLDDFARKCMSACIPTKHLISGSQARMVCTGCYDPALTLKAPLIAPSVAFLHHAASLGSTMRTVIACGP